MEPATYGAGTLLVCRPEADNRAQASAFSSNPWTPYEVKRGVCMCGVSLESG